MREGHAVQIAAPAQYARVVQERQVSFFPLPGDFLALLDTPEGKAAVAGGRGFSAGLKLLKHMRPLMRQVMDEELRAITTFTPDVIIYHPKSIVSPYIATVRGCISILASLLPGFTRPRRFRARCCHLGRLGRSIASATSWRPRACACCFVG
jgi:hypothetical protein